MNLPARLPELGADVVHPSDGSPEAEATAGEVMLRHPKTLPGTASVTQVRAALSNDHMHMVLLTEGRRLVGTLTRTDLPPGETLAPALAWSTLVGRTVSPDSPTTVVRGLLIDQGIRRVAVVAADGSLLGLICLKQRRTGFCADADVDARSRTRDEPTSQA